MAEVLDAVTMVAKNKSKEHLVRSGLYFDNVEKNTCGEAITIGNSQAPIHLAANTPTWENDPKYAETMDNIEKIRKRMAMHYRNHGMSNTYANASQFPTDYYDLINYDRLIITRLAAEKADYTGIFTQEEVIPTLSQKVGLEEFRDFAGIMSEFKGRGDTVNMIEHKTGDERVKFVKLYGLGDSRTLEDELFNMDIYTLEKSNRAFAKAYVSLRNDLSIGSLLHAADGTTARTYDSAQAQAAISSGSTYDENLYLTILNAYKVLRVLKDPQTGDEIDASRCMIATNYAAAWDIERVIRGQINDNKGKPINLSPMNFITSIIPYKGESITANGQTKAYSGVAANTAYLFVPGSYNAPAWTKVKRVLTYEVGQGDVFSFGREKKVGYFGQTNYLDEFFGGSADAAAKSADSKLVSGTGYVVKITLPTT